MIGKVMRGRAVGGLLRYLFGPGRANEHVDPHLVASWDDHPAGLESAVTGRVTDRAAGDMAGGGRRDVRTLTRLLEQPLSAAVRTPDRPVWHCAVRTAPSDRRLSDAEWRDVARDIVARTGLAPDGDDGGCRWVAVRHADDHIHLVVTLARQDGAPARTGNDFYRVGEACRVAEARFGLARTAGRDRTAARRPSRAETEKATRSGLREPARVTLRREVRTAAAAAATGEEFLARLADAGLLVRPRFDDRDPGVVTGYSVARPGDRNRAGGAVWFGAGRLAADLSWPKLTRRWATGHDTGRDTGQGARHDTGHRAGQETGDLSGRSAGHSRGGVRPGRVRLTGHERAVVWRDAAAAAATATDDVRRLAATDPDAASDIAHATGRALSATARVVEGRDGGPLTEAADLYDRAARDLHGRIPVPTRAGSGLRSVARLVALTGRAARDETTQVLALVANLADLADAVAELRDVQQRTAQAVAASQAADRLHAVPAAARPPTAGAPTPAAPVVAAAPTAGFVHNPPSRGSVHRSAPRPGQHAPPRRTLQP